jgi:ribulose-bisphosphate carboxylase small chain
MRITQGTFSFLPDLTDREIEAQIQYAIDQGWACAVEFTDDPHPRNTYWQMFGLPLFGVQNAADVMRQVDACRNTWPNHYIKVNAFDSTRGVESVRLSFIVNRPQDEPGFSLVRQEVEGRHIRYTTVSYAAERPAGKRY